MEIMFIVLCRDISLVLRTREISLHKTIHMISTGDPPFTCSCYSIVKLMLLEFGYFSEATTYFTTALFMYGLAVSGFHITIWQMQLMQLTNMMFSI